MKIWASIGAETRNDRSGNCVGGGMAHGDGER